MKCFLMSSFRSRTLRGKTSLARKRGAVCEPLADRQAKRRREVDASQRRSGKQTKWRLRAPPLWAIAYLSRKWGERKPPKSPTKQNPAFCSNLKCLSGGKTKCHVGLVSFGCERFTGLQTIHGQRQFDADSSKVQYQHIARNHQRIER